MTAVGRHHAQLHGAAKQADAVRKRRDVLV